MTQIAEKLGDIENPTLESKIDIPIKTINFYVSGLADKDKDGGWCTIMNANVKGVEYTKKLAGYGKETTDTRMTLVGLLAALNKLKFKQDEFYFINFYTHSVQVSQALNKNLKQWKKNNFRTTVGTLVKHADLYKELSDFIDNHMLSIKTIRQAKNYAEPLKQSANISAEYVLKAKLDIYEVI